jgi:hypothetical protein
VWADVSGRANSAGIVCLNSGTLGTFLRACGVPYAGSGC